MTRLLTCAEQRQVQAWLAAPLNSLPAFTDKASMIAARPQWLAQASAEVLYDALCAEGFKLNPNAPGSWLWQKHVADTAIEHSLVFMQCTWKDGPWLRSYSYDICSNKFEDALGDSFPAYEDLTDVQPILELFKRNEEIWHTRGFTVVNHI